MTLLKTTFAILPATAMVAVPGIPNGSPGTGTDPAALYGVIAFGGDTGEEEVFYRADL